MQWRTLNSRVCIVAQPTCRVYVLYVRMCYRLEIQYVTVYIRTYVCTYVQTSRIRSSKHMVSCKLKVQYVLKYICIYIWYVHKCVRVHRAGLYDSVYMYVHTYVEHVHTYVCTYMLHVYGLCSVLTYVRVYCMYVTWGLSFCLHVRTYVCMCVCMYSMLTFTSVMCSVKGEVKKLREACVGAPDLSRELSRAHQYTLQLERQIRHFLAQSESTTCSTHCEHTYIRTYVCV